MAEQLFVLEWSKKQNCLHIQPADRMMTANLSAFFDDRQLNDYQVIVVGSKDLCEGSAHVLRSKIAERDGKRV